MYRGLIPSAVYVFAHLYDQSANLCVIGRLMTSLMYQNGTVSKITGTSVDLSDGQLLKF